MSDRRRRTVKEEESEDESQQSDVESGSEADASNEGAELPSYDEAVKLEAEQNNSTVRPAREPRKPREERLPKKDPSQVPRSERFFLHDDRDGEKGGGMRSNRRFEGKPDPERTRKSNKKTSNDDNAWKHDKFEELLADEVNQKPSNSSNNNRTAPSRTNHDSNNVDNVNTGSKRGGDKDNTRTSATKPTERPSTRGPPSNNAAGSDGRNRNSRGPPAAPGASTSANGQDSRATRTSEAGNNKQSTAGRGNDARNAQGSSKQAAPTRGSNPSNSNTVEQSTQRGSERGGRQDSRQQPSRRVERVQDTQAPSTTAPLVQTVRVSMPLKPPPGIKGPPGLDTVALNPSARAFQPTDDSPRPAGSASKAERQAERRSKPESYYEPGFDYSTAVHNASHVQAVLHQQQTSGTTYYPIDATSTTTATPQKSTYVPAATAASPAVTGVHAAVPVSTAPTTQPMAYGSPQPAGQYGAHPGAHTPQSDYRGRRNNNIPSSVPGSAEVDMYGHPHAHNMAMYRGQGVPMQVQGGYMNMPVYDNSMYIGDHSHMQVQGMPNVPMYMPDGSVWYPTISQNMQHSQQGMHAQGMMPADGATTGGTVYYPLPPQPPTTE